MIRDKSEGNEKPVIDLTGPDGNAYVLLGKSRQWAKQLNLNWPDIKDEMLSEDYEHLLATIEKYFGDYVILER